MHVRPTHDYRLGLILIPMRLFQGASLFPVLPMLPGTPQPTFPIPVLDELFPDSPRRRVYPIITIALPKFISKGQTCNQILILYKGYGHS